MFLDQRAYCNFAINEEKMLQNKSEYQVNVLLEFIDKRSFTCGDTTSY